MGVFALPYGWRQAEAVATPLQAERPPWVARWALLFMMLSVTVFSRFGLRLVGGYPIEIGLVALYTLMVTMLWCRWVRLDPLAFVLYGVVLTVATLSLMVNHNFGIAPASANSLVLLAAIYLPFVFALQLPGDTRAAWTWTVRVFGNVALLCALAGIAQFYAQFHIHEPWLFNFNVLTPWRLQGPSGYNTVIPVGELFKSNGFFLREPSHFSFLMALALLLELRSARRLWRIALFGLALLLSYSGTGLLALALGLLFPLGRRTVVVALLAVAGGALLLGVLGDTLNLQFTLDRVSEFGSQRSSAYARYVAPVVRMAEEIDAQPWSALLGQGPGTIQRNVRNLASFDPTWAKLLYEYGLLGLLAMVALVGYCLTRIAAPTSIRVVLFAGWLVMGGYLLSPENCALLYVLLGGWPAADAAASAARGKAAA
jgi:hypothetical protein